MDNSNKKTSNNIDNKINNSKGIKPSNLQPKNNKYKQQTGIPKQVANRMARRVIFTSGLPTVSGMGIFIASYLLVSKGIADIPPGITLITSAICFLLGLAGLSYGILSASWEESSGSFLGLENINPNITRVRAAFKANNSETLN